MRRMVILEHEPPGESGEERHFDWMIERVEGDDPDERVLITFRTDERIDQLRGKQFCAWRIGDHRRAYLTYEGQVSGGRGTVKRVAEGLCTKLVEEDQTLVVEGAFAGTPVRFVGDKGASCWFFCAQEREDTPQD